MPKQALLPQKYKSVSTDKPLVIDWRPMPNTPQEMAYHSQADILGFGGAAGGGKSSLACGLAATAHKKSLILRREYKQLRELENQLKKMIGSSGEFNSTKGIFRLNDGRTIELGSLQYDKDSEKYQGIDHDLLIFDEATHFSPEVIKYLMIWLRSTDVNQRCRCVLTFNPPTSPQALWIKTFFAPWVDKRHPEYPFPHGKLKYYSMEGDREVERPNGDPYEYEGEILKPISRTFIGAKLSDNEHLAQTNYKAVLQSLPEHLKKAMLEGSFELDLQDCLDQCIPYQWLAMANERWNQSIQPPIPQTAIGCDPSRGGNDSTCIAVRYGDWFAPVIVHPGNQCPDGIVVAKHVINTIDRYSTPYINVDTIGVGGAVLDALLQFNCDAYGIVVSKATDKMDAKQLFSFKNLRSYMWWNLRELLDPAYGSTLAIPPDSELIAELCAPMYRINNYQIQVESKDDIRKRIGRSTDRADALLMALLPEGLRYSDSFTSQSR